MVHRVSLARAHAILFLRGLKIAPLTINATASRNA